MSSSFRAEDNTVCDGDLDGESVPIRLQKAINLNDYINGGGAVLEVAEAMRGDTDGAGGKEEPEYFSQRDGKDFDAVLKRVYGLYDDTDASDDDEDDEGLSLFERRARKMKPLLEDGSIKKRVIRRGLASSGAIPPRATVTFHINLYVDGYDDPFDSSEMRQKPERKKVIKSVFIH